MVLTNFRDSFSSATRRLNIVSCADQSRSSWNTERADLCLATCSTHRAGDYVLGSWRGRRVTGGGGKPPPRPLLLVQGTAPDGSYVMERC
ncbi:hypothetical protein EYF80_036578 [Liparis tanakae]|uniref:Uncharacterized protein n=1 Tax=Liparis tanakae TaxID=230148 RepID=A0A4Z2GI82_9TELE|nr:hypothetical protein EYF80_036578 [Liparis tanakae]